MTVRPRANGQQPHRRSQGAGRRQRRDARWSLLRAGPTAALPGSSRAIYRRYAGRWGADTSSDRGLSRVRSHPTDRIHPVALNVGLARLPPRRQSGHEHAASASADREPEAGAWSPSRDRARALVVRGGGHRGCASPLVLAEAGVGLSRPVWLSVSLSAGPAVMMSWCEILRPPWNGIGSGDVFGLRGGGFATGCNGGVGSWRVVGVDGVLGQNDRCRERH